MNLLLFFFTVAFVCIGISVGIYLRIMLAIMKAKETGTSAVRQILNMLFINTKPKVPQWKYEKNRDYDAANKAELGNIYHNR